MSRAKKEEALASVKCRPVRIQKKTGPKEVIVEKHKRSTPQPLPQKCK